MERLNEYIVGVVDGKTITKKEYKVESDPSKKWSYAIADNMKELEHCVVTL
jgi:hypothetical protein